MRILFLVVGALLLSWGIVAYADSCPAGQTWNDCSGPQFGGGGCIPGCFGEPTSPSTTVTGPSELCLPDGCHPVVYSWLGSFVVAESRLPNGYAVMGWSGPCLALNQQCPDILSQAFNDLRVNALRANRAQRYE